MTFYECSEGNAAFRRETGVDEPVNESPANSQMAFESRADRYEGRSARSRWVE